MAATTNTAQLLIDPEEVQAVAVSAIPSSDSPLTERGKEQELWLTAEENVVECEICRLKLTRRGTGSTA